MESGPVVDINKLRHLTKSHPQSPSLRNSIDFSDFAAKNFEKSTGVTQPPKKEHVRKQSKWVYNEVQRNSINFGISVEDMIAYHQQKKFEQLRNEDVQHGSVNVGQNKENHDPFNEQPALKSPFAIPKNSPQFERAENLPRIPRIAPPRPKTRPPTLNIGTPSGIEFASANRTPPAPPEEKKETEIGTPTRPQQHHMEDSQALTRSSSSKILKRKSSASSKHNSFIDTGDFKSKLSPSNLRRRSSQVSSRSSINSRPNSIPTQRECHSVEETLLADEEFNDYTVPSLKSRTSSYFAKNNEFNFEKPLSRTSSLGSFRSPDLNRSSSSQFKTLPTSPKTPTRQPRQRHSVSDFQRTDESSPGLRSTRSFSTNDTFGSSPVRYSPRMSLRTSMSDLKASPIEKISEHEILHFGSPQ